MKTMHFEESWGTLYDLRAISQKASNLTELWWTDSMQRILLLWSQTEGKGCPIASDYDKFHALCLCMPALVGHPIERYCKEFLERHLACTLPITAENCDAIWRQTAEALLLHPQTVGSLLEKDGAGRYLLWDCDAPLQALPNGVLPVLAANRLLACAESDLAQWETCIRSKIETLSAMGCHRIFLSLSSDFTFVAPDPYHVGEVLAKRKKNLNDQNLLLSQLFRTLCRIALEKGWGIHLTVSCAVQEAIALLAYAERSVGIPPVFWSATDARVRNEMLTFGLEAHQNPLLPVLRLCDYPSDEELRAVLKEYAARFPIGMLRFSCSGDLRTAYTEHRRLLSIEF